MSKKQSKDEVQIVPDVTLRLIDARQKLQNGWTRGAFKYKWSSGRVSYCILGALGYSPDRDAARQLFSDMEATGLIRAILPKHVPINIWNDEKGRTQAEVLSVMDKAIARSMNRG